MLGLISSEFTTSARESPMDGKHLNTSGRCHFHLILSLVRGTIAARFLFQDWSNTGAHNCHWTLCFTAPGPRRAFVTLCFLRPGCLVGNMKMRQKETVRWADRHLLARNAPLLLTLIRLKPPDSCFTQYRSAAVPGPWRFISVLITE